MAQLKDKKTLAVGTEHAAGSEYRGKQTRTGNSSGFRFEGALFKSHPEFNGEVKAHIIAPGRMLVTAETAHHPRTDPVMASFLAFLGQDIERHPETVQPLEIELSERMARLAKGITVHPDEDLGDGVPL